MYVFIMTLGYIHFVDDKEGEEFYLQGYNMV
jgi:hypothetical protein